MSYSPTDKPTVYQLCDKLSSVTYDWKHFAKELPGIDQKHIDIIGYDHRNNSIQCLQRALFQKWLDVHPGATWSNVYDALVSVEKVSLARSLVKVVNQSVSDISSSPMSLPHTPPSQQQRQVLQIDQEDEQFIEESLTQLHKTFIEIIYQVKVAFSDLVTHQPAQLHNIIRYAEEAVSPSRAVRLDVSSIDEFFHEIRLYYDFLDCEVITTIAEKFVDGKLAQKLTEHSSTVREFRRKQPIKRLAKELHRAFANVQNLPTLEAKLETAWEDVVIDRLYVLIQHLLPNAVKKHRQYSLMNNIVISPGCLLLQYGIRDRSMIDTIIQHVRHNIKLMRLIGVFQLAVDGTPVIHEDEGPSFSFNTSLLDATKASNNVAVQCLLDIGANVNYQDDDGDTALIWAVDINNIDIIHQLLQAGADVHIQAKDGVTALMMACAGSGAWDLPPDVHRLSDDYRDTVRLLLSHGADLLADVVVYGVLASPFDVACVRDNIDVVEILLTDYNIPPEAVVRGLYHALLGAATNTIKLLQSKITDVDPLAIKLGVSCGEGDIETVKSLIEQGVDPNTVIVHGLTPLMIASSQGHINIADTLIQNGAKVNMVDDIRHWTALDCAEYEGDGDVGDDDMISLLQQYGGVHSKDTPTKASQDTPINESPNKPQDISTTNRYKIPLSFISKRFHKIRKLGGRLITFRRPKPRHNIHSNIILGPNHPVTQK